MDLKRLVEKAIVLDAELKEKKRELDSVKAEIQKMGFAELEDKNLKSVTYYAPGGSAVVGEAQALDVLSYKRLSELFTDVWDTKTSSETKTAYKLNKKFESALKAIATKDYLFDYTLEEFLDQMQIKPSADQKKVLLKKLKGDFVKDKALLESVLGKQEEGFYDVELWHIYKIKNAELVYAFANTTDEEFFDKVRKFIAVETKSSLTLVYESEE